MINDPSIMNKNDQGPFEFWEKNEKLREHLLNIEELATPNYKKSDPERFWGFYGSKINLWRDVKPCKSFFTLKHLLTKFDFEDTFLVT